VRYRPAAAVAALAAVAPPHGEARLAGARAPDAEREHHRAEHDVVDRGVALIQLSQLDLSALSSASTAANSSTTRRRAGSPTAAVSLPRSQATGLRPREGAESCWFTND